MSEASSPRRGRKTEEENIISGMEVKYVKYLKILSIPERKRADIKTERITSSGRGWRVVRVKSRGESDSDVETELRDRRGGR